MELTLNSLKELETNMLSVETDMYIHSQGKLREGKSLEDLALSRDTDRLLC